MSQLTEYYKDYDYYSLARFKGSSRPLMIENWLRSKLKPGDAVLDIGCGDGSYAEWMPEFKWTGIDIGEPKKPYNGTRLVYDLEKSPYELLTGSFNAVVCSETLEHLWSPELVHKEVYRLLNRRGIYVLSTPNFNWIEHQLGGWQQVLYNPRVHPHTKEHIRFYTLAVHKKMLDEAGFRIADFQGADLQWGEYHSLARWEIKKATNLPDGEIDLLLGRCFRDSCHTIGIIAEKK